MDAININGKKTAKAIGQYETVNFVKISPRFWQWKTKDGEVHQAFDMRTQEVLEEYHQDGYKIEIK